jgi:hypothetical protein
VHVVDPMDEVRQRSADVVLYVVRGAAEHTTRSRQKNPNSGVYHWFNSGTVQSPCIDCCISMRATCYQAKLRYSCISGNQGEAVNSNEILIERN